MAVNIGPKIGIEGEKEYRKQVNDLITQQKTFSAQMKELESSFDESTSAMEKNRKKSELLEKQISNQEKQVSELEKGLKAATEAYGEDSAEANKWKQAVSNGKTELNKMRKELDKIPNSMQTVGKSMQDTGKKISSVGSSLTKYVSAPLAGLAAASVAAFSEVDEGLDIVTTKTGATGEALESLQGSVKNLAGQIPTDFATAGEAIGEVNTRFGLTGTELETLSGKFVKFAQLNNTDVSSSVDNVQKLMAAFGVETEDAGDVLDVLNKVGQDTGISMDKLESSMIKNATALQNMGLDAYQAANFIGQVETSGANVETVMSGMSKALTNAAKDGKTLPEALSEFQSIMQSSTSDQEKLNAAMELFGNKAGPAIYEACKQGSLSFESLSTDASKYLGSVETTFENTLDAPDKMKIALNNLKSAGSDLGGTLLNMAVPAIEKVGEGAESAREFFEGLTEEQQAMVGYMVVAFAAGGPALVAVGNLVTAAGKVAEGFGKIPGAVQNVAGAISALGSPAGLALLGLGALTAVMIASRDEGIKSNEALQEMLSSTSEATTQLNEATAGLQETITEADKNIEDINAKASTAEDLVNELYALEAQSEKTTAEQARMKVIVDELNTMYPNLSLSIDQTTGALNKGKTEVKGYIDEAKKLALIEAYGKASQEVMQKLATASVSLKKAQAAQAEGQAYVTQAQKEYNEAIANAPEAMTGQNAILDEATGKWHLVDANITNAANAVKLAEGNMIELNQAVTDGEQAVSSAEEEYQLYVDSAEELSSTLTETTTATEEHTEAVEEETTAMNENAGAVAARAAELAKDVASAVANIGSEVQAWDDLYQATKESIEGQLGLFDEWTENTDLTAEQMLANLQSQGEGMKRYSSNMAKLSKAAVDSSDPNFKALVKSIADMGIKGAGEAQTLVNAMEKDKDLFNSILAQFGENSGSATDELAGVLTYIEGDFKTRGEAALVGVVKAVDAIGKSPGFQQLKSNAMSAMQSVGDKVKEHRDFTKIAGNDIAGNLALGYKTLPNTAATASNQAKTSTEATINGMYLAPTVSKVGVPASVTNTAKQTITDGVDDIHGKVSQVDGATSAAKTACAKASESATINATVKVGDISAVAWDVKTRLQNWFASNPIVAAVRAAASASHNAEGGIIRQETLSWLAEGDKPEAVIPLAASQRSNALELYEQTGRILGVQSASVSPVTMRMPNNPSEHVTASNIMLNTDQLYAAVAAAAKKGMESADIRIYWDNREAGRIMKNMGVRFV